MSHALAATLEATVVHVYNTAMISKRVHSYRKKQAFPRCTACLVSRGKRPAEPRVAGLTGPYQPQVPGAVFELGL